MSKITIALEAAVADIRADNNAEGQSTAHRRARIDRNFTIILRLIAPRIRHFIRQYGLVAHWEDAEQCCAIAVHRAILGYDPNKAQFTTFVNWQIRGELQGLRFRLMADQRPSAKKVAATTVSLNAATNSADGVERTLEAMIEDEYALSRTESGASDFLAMAATTSLIDAFIDDLRTTSLDQLRRKPRPKSARDILPVGRAAGMPGRAAVAGVDPEDLAKLDEKLARDRQIVERRVFDAAGSSELELDGAITKERVRQITKRAAKTIADLAGSRPKFAVMADYLSGADIAGLQASRTAGSRRQSPSQQSAARH